MSFARHFREGGNPEIHLKKADGPNFSEPHEYQREPLINTKDIAWITVHVNRH